MRDRRAGDTAQRQKVSKGLAGQRVVCVGDWRGYVSAVGVAFSGVAGDGVLWVYATPKPRYKGRAVLLIGYAM